MTALFRRLARHILTGSDADRTEHSLETRERVLARVEADASRYDTHAEFPFAHANVVVRAADATAAAHYQAALLSPPLGPDVEARLRQAGHVLPASFQVTHRVVEAWPDALGADPGDTVHVAFGASAANPAAPTGALTLRVESGLARDREVRVEPPAPITIGRGQEHPLRGGGVRVNTLAFYDADEHAEMSEEDAALNARVGRIHATIRYEPETQAYRLMWDGRNALTLLRAGAALRVSNKHQVVFLQDGDRIQLADGPVLAVSVAS